MNFDALVKYIRKDGCPVRVYNKGILKVAQCLGTFDVSKKGTPTISIATRGHTKLENTRVLLHEYAHYRQWKDGLMGIAERVIKGWDVLDKWLSGKEYDSKQLSMARNCVILIEYDAEIRTIQLSRILKVDIGDIEDYLDHAHSYITHLKTVFKTKKWSPYRQLSICKKRLRPKEILAALSKEEVKRLEAINV